MSAIADTEPQLRPELLPTFATGALDDSAVCTSARVEDGDAGWFGPAKSRMVPLASIVPGTISAIAASTLLGAPCSAGACDR